MAWQAEGGGDVDPHQADRRDPEDAEARALLHAAAEREAGGAGVVEGGDPELLQCLPPLEAVLDLDAARDGVGAADDVALDVAGADPLVGVAAHALVAAGEEALGGRQVTEVAGGGVADVGAADQSEAPPLVEALHELGVG